MNRTVDNRVINERVCKWCSTQKACPTNEGIHTEIYDGETLFAKSAYWPGGLPRDAQHGVCSRCHHPMEWSPTRFRWVDWVGRTPEQELAEIMEAWERGRISDETYYSLLEDRARQRSK